MREGNSLNICRYCFARRNLLCPSVSFSFDTELGKTVRVVASSKTRQGQESVAKPSKWSVNRCARHDALEGLDNARLNVKRASPRSRGGEPSREMGPHNIRRIDISSVFRRRPAGCTHVCGTRVQGDDLPSMGPVSSMVDDVRVALRINNSTCYCCAV